MYLKTVSFIVDTDDTLSNITKGQLENLGLFPCTEEVTDIGTNYFCSKCGYALTTKEIAMNLAEVRKSLSCDGFICEVCIGG